jgi:hypothetical protein
MALDRMTHDRKRMGWHSRWRMRRINKFIVGLRWVIKSYLSELKPNSGTSIKDQISRLKEARVDDLFVLISKR